jgi:hypothetical protein
VLLVLGVNLGILLNKKRQSSNSASFVQILDTSQIHLKKSARSYLLYLLTSYVLAEWEEYMIDTFASASQEFCAPGGLYFGYSVFPGVMLASLMHTPESLFQTF